MSIKKTYIPAKPRSSKLVGTSMSGGVAGGVSSSSAGSTDPNSHSHLNKRVLDSITQEMLDNALREMLGVESTEEATDENYFSALRTLAEIIDNNEGLKDLFLSKVDADTAKEVITFLKGALFGEFSSGIHTGRGARIDEEGNLEAQSAVLRSFLEVPSIKYNQLEVLGEETGIGAGGIIEEVDKITTPEGDVYMVKLKLKEGAANEFQRDDIVKGIFHQFEDLQEGELAGFQTSWFRVQSIDGAYMDLVMGADSEVPGGKNYPPRKFMNIAKRGNFTVPERQFSIILSSKTGNIVMYDGVDNYKSGTVVSQWGKPSGLEFIDGYQDLPINHDEALQYVKTLLVENIVRIDVNGVVKKEITDRGAWSLATAQSDEPYLNNEEHIHEVWHKAAKYRCIVNMTLNEPSSNSPDWIQIFEIEGVVGDSVRFKYKNSIAKPERPTGDGDGWRDTPDNDGPAPEVPLVPIGPNLYDRQYLLNQGWDAATTYAAVYKIGGTTGWVGNIVDSSKFQENTQYRFTQQRSWFFRSSDLTIYYTDGSSQSAHENFETQKNKTVSRIEVWIGAGSAPIFEIWDDTTLHELGEGVVSVETLWFSQQSTVNGVTTPWSDPSPWLTEGGQPGEPGKAPEIRNGYWWAYNNSTNDWYNTGVKAEGKDGKPGKGINLKPAVANYAALPPAYQNSIDDARVTLDTGHLWVWDGTQWNDNGPFKGQDGENGVNYLNMGNWDINMVYRITDLGIPMVRVPIGSTGNYTVYTLKVTNSTLGVQPSTQQGLTEWKLIDSTDMIFMEQAYVQKLQAQLITAEKIEALDISVKKLTTPFLTVDNSDATYNSSRRVYKINNDLNLSAGSFDAHGRGVTTWIELPDDASYIGTRIVILNANFPPYTYSQTSIARTVVCVSSTSRLKGVGVGGEPKTGSLDGREDPYAVAFIGCMMEFICVPRVEDGVIYPYWIATNWNNSIEIVEWA